MFNFPNTPNVGDTISLDGITWVWDGVKWSHAAGAGDGGGGVPPGTVISDTAPANPVAGLMWWDPVSAKLFIWDSAQWIVVVNTPSGGGGDSGEASGPLMGYTGGAAAAGQIGEIIFASNDSGSIASGVTSASVGVPISIPAGIWLVLFRAFFMPVGSGTPSASSIRMTGQTVPPELSGFFSNGNTYISSGTGTMNPSVPFALPNQSGTYASAVAATSTFGIACSTNIPAGSSLTLTVFVSATRIG